MTTTPGTLVPHPHVHQFYIILVEPEESLNIGSVARAMKNLGFIHLRLVDPKRWSRERAAITACWGEDILDTAQRFATFPEAIADLEEVIGFSVREGKNRAGHMVYDEYLAKELRTPPKKTGLVFGPEDNGLRQEHTDLCRCLVRIPSTESCRAFNLAQSALIALYELSKVTWNESVERASRTLPTWNEFYQLDRMVDQVLTHTGYYHKGTPGPVPGLVKMMVRRMNPDDREMRVLLGIFSRIEKALSGEVPLSPLEEERDEN